MDEKCGGQSEHPQRIPRAGSIMAQRWPATLWIVRHGESAGNVAAREGPAGEHRFRLDLRDADVPLSALGETQAYALGLWFANGQTSAKPDIVLASPYVRARETARRIQEVRGMDKGGSVLIDERLREKETGILDGLTPDGVAALHPEQALQRALIGKFYHRPPGGENWCDVIQRLRGVIDRISLHHAGQNVLVVAHEVVVFCMRYIVENMDEAGILAVDAQGDVANCAVTEYRFDAATDSLILTRFNETEAVEAQGAPVTLARDGIVAARG
jgi:ribonuclease H / adenosylcobalamin/alpha-ribazole phosphatase